MSGVNNGKPVQQNNYSRFKQVEPKTGNQMGFGGFKSVTDQPGAAPTPPQEKTPLKWVRTSFGTYVKAQPSDDGAGTGSTKDTAPTKSQASAPTPTPTPTPTGAGDLRQLGLKAREAELRLFELEKLRQGLSVDEADKLAKIEVEMAELEQVVMAFQSMLSGELAEDEDEDAGAATSTAAPVAPPPPPAPSSDLSHLGAAGGSDTPSTSDAADTRSSTSSPAPSLTLAQWQELKLTAISQAMGLDAMKVECQRRLDAGNASGAAVLEKQIAKVEQLLALWMSVRDHRPKS